MRHYFAFLAIVGVIMSCAMPSNAGKPDKLIGLSEEQLISCAGIPAGQMASGGTAFCQNGEFSELGASIPLARLRIHEATQ